jgi:hypothetical protein
MAYYATREGRFFRDRVLAANELLDLSDKRVELDEGSDAKAIYYWIVNIERAGRQIGMRYYSRRGKKTLIGVLYAVRLWLRANVYEPSKCILLLPSLRRLLCLVSFGLALPRLLVLFPPAVNSQS